MHVPFWISALISLHLTPTRRRAALHSEEKIPPSHREPAAQPQPLASALRATHSRRLPSQSLPSHRKARGQQVYTQFRVLKPGFLDHYKQGNGGVPEKESLLIFCLTFGGELRTMGCT